LIAKITAQITEVLPNGNLRIQGRRRIKVNNEEQIISVEGIIRPADINEDNSIYSIYIADAQIKYEGKGVLGENQRPGILRIYFVCTYQIHKGGFNEENHFHLIKFDDHPLRLS